MIQAVPARLAAVFALAIVILTIGVFLEACATARSPEDWIPEDQMQALAQFSAAKTSLMRPWRNS